MRTHMLYYSIIAITSAFFLISVLLVTVDCPIPSGYYWNISGNLQSCPTQVLLGPWLTVCVADMQLQVDQMAGHDHTRYSV